MAINQELLEILVLSSMQIKSGVDHRREGAQVRSLLSRLSDSG